MKLLLIIMVAAIVAVPNANAQQQIEYRLKIQGFEGLEYKESQGVISSVFEPCTSTHDANGTLVFTTYHQLDSLYIVEQTQNLGYTVANLEIAALSNNEPSIGLSASKAANQDCADATLVCSNSTFAGNSNGTGTQELNALNHGCLIDDERQSSWYYLYVGTSGTLGMTIAPTNGMDDYDFAIWGPFDPSTLLANCPPTDHPIRCNFTSYPDWFPGTATSCGTVVNPTGMQVDVSLPTSSDACTDEPYSRHLDVIAGEIYIMVIDNWSTSSDPFDLTWNGSGELSCAPIPLPVELNYMDVQAYGNSNHIEWETQSERDNDYFEVQCKSEFKDWTTIHNEPGAGHSTDPIHYSYVDLSFSPTINYYRLKQVDYNGKSTLTEMVSVDNRPRQSKIRSCTNLLGQAVPFDFDGVKIILFEDGTKEMVLQNN